MTNYNVEPNTSPAEPSKVLAFTPRCEQCHKSLKVCGCDVFVGCCSPCGNPIYTGEDYRSVESIDRRVMLTCAECLAEEREWRHLPAAARKAA